MSEHNQANNNTAKTGSGDDYRGSLGDLYWVVSSASIAFVLLLLAALFWPNLTERTKFFTANLFNLMVAFAVIAQVVIYRNQWIIMKRQLQFMTRSESAYLSVADLEIPPLRKYHLVVNGKIFNRGKTPALDVQRRIQIAIGKGTPPIGWGRFDWNFSSDECESIVLAADDFVNFSTDPIKIDSDLLAEINEGKQTIVIDGQCRYRDSAGDLLVYVFGYTIELNPPGGHIRYQEHRREETNPN